MLYWCMCIYIFILSPLLPVSLFLNSKCQVLPTVALNELFVGVPLILVQILLVGSFSFTLKSWSITTKAHLDSSTEFILPDPLICVCWTSTQNFSQSLPWRCSASHSHGAWMNLSGFCPWKTMERHWTQWMEVLNFMVKKQSFAVLLMIEELLFDLPISRCFKYWVWGIFCSS